MLSEAVRLGYRVLSLDTDISLRANPYPLLHGVLRHHSLITGLDNDRDKSSYVFPNTNVGFVYVRGPAHSAAHVSWRASVDSKCLSHRMEAAHR